MSIVKNQISGHAGTIDLANNTYNVNSFAANTSETVNAIAITHLVWSGDWSIKMGNVTVWQTYANTFGEIDFTAMGLVLNQNPNCSPTGVLTISTIGSTSSLGLRIAKYGYNTVGI